MAQSNFERFKKYYENGWYNEAMLKNLVLKGKLTQQEYEEIVKTNEKEVTAWI